MPTDRAQPRTAANAAPGAPSPAESAAVRRFIDSAEARFVAAANRGDVEAILADLASDAILLRADRPMERGLDAMRREYGGGRTRDNKLTTQEVLVGRDLAVETGRYEYTLLEPGGRGQPHTGKYIFVWRRQPDGSWKGALDADIPDAAR